MFAMTASIEPNHRESATREKSAGLRTKQCPTKDDDNKLFIIELQQEEGDGLTCGLGEHDSSFVVQFPHSTTQAVNE